MESIIGIEGGDFVLIAADVANARSVVVMKDDMDKITKLDTHKLFAAAGTPGDVVKFTEHVMCDVKLNNLRLGIPMSTAAVANFTRGELARFLRKSPYQCNVLIGGMDAEEPSLYSCDYLGTLTKLKFAAEGYAQYFVLSTLDRYWKKNMTVDDALIVIRKCINEVQKRLVINQPRFAIKIVDKDGVRIIDAADANCPVKLATDAEAAASASVSADSAKMETATASA